MSLKLAGNFLLSSTKAINLAPGGLWSTIFNRTNIRNNFPRAKETKRIRTHGWEKRLSTVDGRKTIMRRILKGRHVLSH